MPPSPQNQPPQVSALSAGLAKIRTEWANFAGDLLEPMVILAAGGTKAQAAWAGMKGVFLSKVLGLLGMVVGLATSFLFLSMDIDLLYESSYTDFNPQGVDGVFDPKQVDELVSILEDVRQRAVV